MTGYQQKRHIASDESATAHFGQVVGRDRAQHLSSRVLEFGNGCALPVRIRLQRGDAAYPRPCTTIGARTVGRRARFGRAPPPKAGGALAQEHLAERQ
jgi:hypothetical protein